MDTEQSIERLLAQHERLQERLLDVLSEIEQHLSVTSLAAWVIANAHESEISEAVVRVRTLRQRGKGTV